MRHTAPNARGWSALLFVFGLAALVCSCGGDGGGDGGTGGGGDGPPAADSLDLGEASVDITLDSEGCLDTDVPFTSSRDRAVRLPAGCLTFRDGAAVSELTVRIRPQTATTVTAGESGLRSAYQLLLVDGQGQPVSAGFDPPLEIAIASQEPGGWYVTGYIDGDEWSQDDVDGAAPYTLDAITRARDGSGTVRVRQTGVFGITYEPIPDTAAKGDSGSPVVQTLELSGDETTPLLCTWTLINQLSAEIVVAGWEPLGAPLGSTRSLARDGHVFTFTYSQETGASPQLTVESPFSNLFRAEVTQCSASVDAASSTSSPMQGGCAEADCPDAAYIGSINSTLIIDGGLSEWLSAFGELESVLSSPERAVIYRLQALDSGQMRGIVGVLKAEASVPSIVDRFTDKSMLSDDDRLLAIGCESVHPGELVWPAIFAGEWNITITWAYTTCTPGVGCRQDDNLQHQRTLSPECGHRIATGGFGLVAVPGVSDVVLTGSTVSWNGSGTRAEPDCDPPGTYAVSMTGSYTTDGDTLTGTRNASYTGDCQNGIGGISGTWRATTTGTRIEP